MKAAGINGKLSLLKSFVIRNNLVDGKPSNTLIGAEDKTDTRNFSA